MVAKPRASHLDPVPAGKRKSGSQPACHGDDAEAAGAGRAIPGALRFVAREVSWRMCGVALQKWDAWTVRALEVNTVHMNVLLSACARRGKWLTACGLLDTMTSRQARVPSLTDVSRAGSFKPVQWKTPQVGQDIISCSSVVTACEKGNAWVFGMNLLEHMQLTKVQMLASKSHQSRRSVTSFV